MQAMAQSISWEQESALDWNTITSGDSGTDAGTITVNSIANTSTVGTRTATITETAGGATGSPKQVVITQATAAPSSGHWQFIRAFTPKRIVAGAHGIAVDPLGRVWIAPFYASETVGPKVAQSLYILNPDGTPASFSPLKIFSGVNILDTLSSGYENRGLSADPTGNIVGSWYDRIYRFNYQSGAAMNRIDVVPGKSSTQPVVDTQNEVFVGTVAPGSPVYVYNRDFSFRRVAVQGSNSYVRSMAISSDGNDLYCGDLDAKRCVVYHSVNGSSGPYILSDSLMSGGSPTSFGWQPVTGYLWMDAGNPTLETPRPGSGWTPLMHYAFDVETGAVKDSIMLDTLNTFYPTKTNVRARGIAFSPSGDTAYIAIFNVDTNYVQMFRRNKIIPPDILTSKVVGYYPMWKRSTLTASDIKFNYITHINHAFAVVAADGTFSLWGGASIDTALINTTHRSGRKILLSFVGPDFFPIVARDSTLRNRFAHNVVSFLAANKYDGVDLDWEFPANSEDKVNEVALVRDLRSILKSADSPLYLTMAVGVTNELLLWRDLQALQPYVDWFNAMTYDFHGDWSVHAGHNAPVYAPTDAVHGCVNDAITSLTSTVHIPAQKIVLGLPFYGKEYQATQLLGPFTGARATRYAEAMFDIAHQWSYVWDSTAQVPYLIDPSKTKLVTFDDSTSITLKCAYANKKELAGVMIWEITQDTLAGRQPLMDVVGKAMWPTTEVFRSPGNPAVCNFVLFNNYPNPFNPSTTIRYELPKTSQVILSVYDILGREVSVLVNERKDAGVHEVKFDAAGLASGVYFYRLQAGNFVQTRKLLLVR
jgi:chitinase